MQAHQPPQGRPAVLATPQRRALVPVLSLLPGWQHPHLQTRTQAHTAARGSRGENGLPTHRSPPQEIPSPPSPGTLGDGWRHSGLGEGEGELLASSRSRPETPLSAL